MELTQLINSVSAIQVTGNIQRKDVSDIVYDSRKVHKNSVFVAVKGFKNDGHRYLLEAITKGAIAVVVENNEALPDELIVHSHIAKILVKDSRKALAELSKGFYKNPSDTLKLIGITGTNGKTTSAFIIKNILQSNGYKSGLIGTIANYIGDEKIDSKLTTPESNDLNKMFYEMIKSGCEYAVMEVSSHSLVLNRVYGLNFRVAVFSNITSDHLDFHTSFVDYLKAKKILFDNLSSSSFAIINSDDKNSKEIVKDSKAEVFTYGVSEGSDYQIKNIVYDLMGTDFTIMHNKVEYKIHTSLVGTFNAYNAASAFAAAHCLGFNTEKIVKGIESTPQVPGRFEVLGKGKKKIIVDYSHTADSLEKALQAIREIVKDKKQVVTVFGCGGDRDKTKRPVMGKIASELSDRVFITSDNPRTENPFTIIDDIKKGISKNNFELEENREEAIKKAIQSSDENAVILIAGKGHESYQEINGIRNHFSDQEVALRYLV
ncbi:MAG: UDP-N-acetylmuramoyl-L-alanyl-D-glutamate--2,6-diaminopimelate ligase [Ignavibacteriales bacterium UTCHB2]|jgi:UDP-N-acetylmuramoyl-L-alanyl-D-glutamate--2,6-diaminopimelate ligase|nr:MAG: UDP-N-acetylmuramoyl-L-alanyl-D-glutamate--L-lysine ligase [Ignavibacteria bacterium ADurb.Bin266]OQY70398.1 MAG: UDP-N-acetylmuramoyl-L-alanyl-D-glutamate--2,6-diaminopimelate ligase [Ignavibacteriales bacterium UTCHB2]HQI39636.1 UDP-N-acetylmuramoyl-L-alanyl-D-glutamate--2,6-diaminopimelate ligase [Ignavibacteriaceae bacterium]HQJ45274.1 UDP-N-acetylmuramoyl-L-alanyl-D-glutamate--2,6-diaminopimelate ligase [Ignavibacteriaceae bacterium]